MGDALLKKHHFTVAEYEALEAAAEEGVRYEFVDGLVYAMSGASAVHNQIVQNAAFHLRGHFRPRGCRVFTETVKLAAATGRRYVYPDVMFSLSERDRAANQMMQDPVLLIEVLSESTEGRDLRKKLNVYQAIPSLQAYVMVDQYECWVRVYERDAAGNWLPHRLLDSLSDALYLRAVEWQIPLQELYQDIVFVPKE
jgi:Uma2 family endonuclease